jgi:hypothetical protein
MKEFKNKVSSGIFAFYDDEIELVPWNSNFIETPYWLSINIVQ